MGKCFGTDGIRGVANTELTADLAYRTGFALGCQLYGDLQRKPRVLIGRDTRISGTMLEAALTAGLCAAGSDVVSLGVLPTPAVARATVTDDKADAGIVISASHNPYEHNGIKIFGGDGYKLTDAQEAAIEAAIDLMAKDAILNVAVYPGHEEGEAEGKLICEYLSGISRHKVCATKVQILNFPTSPYFIVIETKPEKP